MPQMVMIKYGICLTNSGLLFFGYRWTRMLIMSGKDRMFKPESNSCQVSFVLSTMMMGASKPRMVMIKYGICLTNSGLLFFGYRWTRALIMLGKDRI